MNSQVLHTVWCNIPVEAAGEIWHWSPLGVKGLISISGPAPSPGGVRGRLHRSCAHRLGVHRCSVLPAQQVPRPAIDQGMRSGRCAQRNDAQIPDGSGGESPRWSQVYLPSYTAWSVQALHMVNWQLKWRFPTHVLMGGRTDSNTFGYGSAAACSRILMMHFCSFAMASSNEVQSCWPATSQLWPLWMANCSTPRAF